MKDVFSQELMYKTEAETIKNKIPSLKLMEYAGEEISRLLKWNARIAIFVGPGNNGGDGFSLALRLYEEGADVVIFFIDNVFTVNANYFFKLCLDKGIQMRKYENAFELAQFDIIVDALFGIGFKGELSDRYQTVIEDINKSEALVVSIDINSGLDANTGLTKCAVKSDITYAIEFIKTGHLLNQAKDYIKKLKVVSIGIDKVEDGYFLIEREDVKQVFRERENFSNKRTFGYTGLIGGSLEYSGAIRLAYMASIAQSSGAGLVRVLTPKRICDIVASNILEEVLYPLSSNDDSLVFNEEEFEKGIKNLDSIAFGMGIINNDETKKALEYLLKNYEGNLVVDADGINILSQHMELLNEVKPKLILTPHVVEFSRLIKKEVVDITSNLIDYAKSFAKEKNVILLLKGPTTIVTDGNKVYLVNRGTAGMATAGSGDVLSGILASVIAYSKEDLLLSVASAAYLNGVAGENAADELNDIVSKSSDTIKHIKDAIDYIRQ